MDPRHARLLSATLEYDRGDPRRIQHFVKVHGFAAAIGVLEGLDPKTQFILETAAILHDIGIHRAERVHHNGHGRYQEIEGPAVAETILRELGGYTDAEIDRVKFLIAHHHTYENVDGSDWQILLEADFLVNAWEDGNPAAVQSMRERLFRTQTGLAFLDAMFDADAYVPPSDPT